MSKEILGNWEEITWKWLNTKNEDLTETLDEQKFREYIWNDLIKKHTKVGYWEVLWYQWKIIRITLPAVWDFWWYKFECFISDKSMKANEMQYNKWYKDFALSKDEMDDFNKAIREYMKSYWVKKYWLWAWLRAADFNNIIDKLFWYGQAFRYKIKGDDEHLYWENDDARSWGYNINSNGMQWHIILKLSQD